MSDGWHDDPLRRYAKRYYDGSGWTVHVSNGEVTEVDPLGIAPTPVPVAPTAPPQTFMPPPPSPPPSPSPAMTYGAVAINGDGLPQGVEYASPWIRLGSYLLEGILMVVTLGIGWIIWALTTAGDGQTPAKKLLGLRAISSTDRRPVGLGTMFWMRGLLAGLVVQVAAFFTLGIIFFMPFWDRRNQNLWDKVSSTHVVTDPYDVWGTQR